MSREFERPPGRLLLLTGAAGAGKSTVGRLWCQRQAEAAHIPLDDIRSLIVSGYADPQEEGPARTRQYEEAVGACLLLARHYIENGYSVAVDDVFPPALFDRLWRPRLEGLSWKVVVLQPNLEEILRRAGDRRKDVKEEIIREQHGAMLLWSEDNRIDVTNLSPEEVVSRIEDVWR